MTLKTSLVGAAAVAVLLVAAPVSAAPLSAAAGVLPAVSADALAAPVIQVQRKRGRGPRAGAPVARRRGNRNAAGAAAAGVAIGIIGGMIAAEAERQRDAVEWCMDRHPNYNPRTQTWIDRRGRRHRCP